MSKINATGFPDQGAALDELDPAVPPGDESMSATIRALKLQEEREDRVDSSNKLTGAELAAAALEGVLDPGNEETELAQLLRHIGPQESKLSPSGHQVVAVLEKYLGLAVRQGGTLTPEQKLQMAEDLTRAAKEGTVVIATPHPQPQGNIVVTAGPPSVIATPHPQPQGSIVVTAGPSSVIATPHSSTQDTIELGSATPSTPTARLMVGEDAWED
jgi:hypothetical protein